MSRLSRLPPGVRDRDVEEGQGFWTESCHGCSARFDGSQLDDYYIRGRHVYLCADCLVEYEEEDDESG